MLTVAEATTGWLETHPVPRATAQNALPDLEKQQRGTAERTESDNGTRFKTNLLDAWAKEHGIESVYHIPHHAPAFGKSERHKGLSKPTLKATGAGTSIDLESEPTY